MWGDVERNLQGFTQYEACRHYNEYSNGNNRKDAFGFFNCKILCNTAKINNAVPIQ